MRKDQADGEAVMTAMTAPSALSAAGSDRQRAVIDDDHLSRMTLGDRRLEREVLEIFVRQTVIMLERIAGAEPALAAAAAHTLTGSARGIGAWRGGPAAEHLESVVKGKSGGVSPVEAGEQLKSATIEASAAIAARLGDVLRGH